MARTRVGGRTSGSSARMRNARGDLLRIQARTVLNRPWYVNSAGERVYNSALINRVRRDARVVYTGLTLPRNRYLNPR